MVVDVTERNRVQRDLAEREENFRAFFEADSDMVVIAGTDGRILK